MMLCHREQIKQNDSFVYYKITFPIDRLLCVGGVQLVKETGSVSAMRLSKLPLIGIAGAEAFSFSL